MPAGVKGFQKGIVTNPKGRPPKDRALTAILERAGAKTLDVGDKKVSGKSLVAAMVWQGITTREVEFPDGEKMRLLPYHWLELVKWMYAHVDGPPKAEIDVSTNGEVIIRVMYADVDADTSAPTFSAEDSH